MSDHKIDIPSASNNKSFDFYSRLLRERIILLNQQVDEDIANLLVAQMLYLEAEDPEKDIYLYINSPGGSVAAGMGIYDTMQQIQPDVATICVGLAAGMGGFLLAGGTAGKRMCLPLSRIMICQSSGGVQVQAINIEIEAREILYLNTKLNEILAKHTGQPFHKLTADIEQDFYMSATEAQAYGLVDKIIERSAIPNSKSNY